MNFSFPSLYKEIENCYINDEEFTEEIVHVLTENVYREEILTLFRRDVFVDSINDDIISLYSKIKDNKNIIILVNILKEKYNDDLIAFTVLFSYDYFYLFLPCLKNIMNEEIVDISSLVKILK
uniref:Uncharacterized protein n=1 Tax=viral metagenome TaxID=1070528 RepID=A0A6C0HQU4_9ZZZZ